MNVKERPILFSGEMVGAILDGRKTQTRRIVKPRCTCGDWSPDELCNSDPVTGWQTSGRSFEWECERCSEITRCPFGETGDRLWVRETWRWQDYRHVGSYDTKTAAKLGLPPFYEKDGSKYAVEFRQQHPKMQAKWRPSIFMPRTASRILLEITNLRVERVNEISEFDALSEGFDLQEREKGTVRLRGGGAPVCRSSATVKFQSAWDKMHGENSYQSGLWVWVIEFKVLQIKD